ncbi:MAG: NAD(P)H-dependent oxidoreductase subunit E [Blastocatellia bacterium]|nr:NAD(P)H-dependent oxidoreductase subunit E [Blastocatellia bacterium]
MTVFKKHVFVCVTGKTCPLQGSTELVDKMKDLVRDYGLKKEMRVNKAGCLGQCGSGPMVVVYPEAVWYAFVQTADAEEIVRSHLVEDRPVERLIYKPEPKK